MSWRRRYSALDRFERTDMAIGNHTYRLTELFSEKIYSEVAERQAVFFAARKEDGMSSVVKVRFQRKPSTSDFPDEPETVIEYGTRLFHREVRALQLTAGLSQTPNLLHHEVKEQTGDLVQDLRGGYLHAIAMTWMPGRSATDYDDLTSQERTYLKIDVIQILKDIAGCGWHIDEGNPDKIIYDRSTRKVSLTCLYHGEEDTPQRCLEIEPYHWKNFSVFQFGCNLWNESYQPTN